MTPEQMRMARHALGLPNVHRRSYRNRYFAPAGTDIERSWDDLVMRGLAERSAAGPGRVFFALTEQGARRAIDPVESLCPEDFPTPQESASE